MFQHGNGTKNAALTFGGRYKMDKSECRSPYFKVKSPYFKVKSPYFKLKSPYFKVKSPYFKAPG